MNYEDDELERMRARREQRRSAGRDSGGGNTGMGETRRSASGGESDAFRSGYSGPKGGSSRSSSSRGSSGRGSSGRGVKQQKTARKSGRRPDKRKKMMILAAEIVLLLVLVIGAAGWYVYERTFGSLQVIEFDEEDVKNPHLSDAQIEGMKGYMNIACFGVDSRSVGGKMNVGKGTNADVNLIASVNLETGEIRLVSVFRDSYLNINDKNSYNKINAAYAQGGPEQAVKALNKNLGLNITQYATFNWKAVADAINLLGGVDITISENEFSWINAYITETVKETGIASTQLTHAGEVHLDGVQAVAYGRLRLGDTDYARTERQRIILAKAFEKAKKADWNTLNCILETVMPQLASNITVTDLIPLARNITKYHMGETSGFPSARSEMDIGKIGDCVVPQTLESNVKELHKFLFDEEDYKIPSNVKEYSEHISDATGLYKEGKTIGHVPVDQGINAKSYINRQIQKQSDKVKATEPKKEEEYSTEESTDETDESSTDESSTVDGSDFSTEDDWDDEDWDDEDWDNENWGNGPGSNGPGSGPGSTQASKPGSNTVKPGTTPGRTTEADDANEGATGPGGNNSSVSKPKETSSGKGSNTPSGNSPAPTSAAPAPTEGNGPSGPGA